jgi:hypothetical protein
MVATLCPQRLPARKPCNRRSGRHVDSVRCIGSSACRRSNPARWRTGSPSGARTSTRCALSSGSPSRRRGSRRRRQVRLAARVQRRRLPASAVSAPNPRFGVFILARRTVPNPAGIGLRQRRRDAVPSASSAWHDRAEPSGDRPRDPAQPPLAPGDVRTDRGLLRRWGRYAPANARWERITGRPAPAPAIVSEGTAPPTRRSA